MLCAWKVTLQISGLACLIGLSTSQCNGTPKILRQNGHIRSPYYGAEYGKTANCTWIFDRQSFNRPGILVLNVVGLKLYEVNPVSQKYCPPEYNFSINGKRYGCNPVLFVERKQPRACRAFISHPACYNARVMKDCRTVEVKRDDVNVTYVSNGWKHRPQYQAKHMWGFKMEFKFARCSQVPPSSKFPTKPSSINKGYTNEDRLHTEWSTISRAVTSSTSSSRNPLNLTTWNLPGDQMKTPRDSFDEGTGCVFRSVTCDVAIAMIALLAGILGFGLGAGCIFIIKRRRNLIIPGSTGVSGWSIKTRSITTVSERAELRSRTSTDHVYVEANDPEQFVGHYEEPLPKGHYEEPKISKPSSPNDYEL